MRTSKDHTAKSANIAVLSTLMAALICYVVPFGGLRLHAVGAAILFTAGFALFPDHSRTRNSAENAGFPTTRTPHCGAGV